MDALYFRVSSEKQTTENQFEDLLQVAERDDSGRDSPRVRGLLADCIYEEQIPTRNGTRTVYRVRPEIAAQLVRKCVYVKQGRSGKAEPSAAPCSSR